MNMPMPMISITDPRMNDSIRSFCIGTKNRQSAATITVMGITESAASFSFSNSSFFAGISVFPLLKTRIDAFFFLLIILDVLRHCQSCRIQH